MFGLGGQKLLLVLIVILPYFIPSFVAASRNHRNMTAIIILNIFLGCSVIGWIVPLVSHHASTDG
ncbi:MAG: superinfection immunity protein [Chlorobium sp.]|nr:MAG: superinfection immunity protein [Chlorobium sp.]